MFFALSLLVLVSLESCAKKDAQHQTEEEAASADSLKLPDDFVAFYDRFHTDSQYQMDHITFPLEGLPNSTGDGDTLLTERFFWQRDDWQRHNHFTDPSGQFEHWYEVLNERIIEHWVQMKGTNLVLRRRFAKLDEDWYLIYYAGMRPKDIAE